ncbi:MAG: hypothetical protein AAF383_11365 [Cyanobacteria bacterium P01_A01_bin.83]
MILEPTFSAVNFGESTDFNLIPISDEAYSPLSIPLPEGSFVASTPQDISLIEEQITLDNNGEVIDNNIHFDRPLIENGFSESVISTYSTSKDGLEILVAAVSDELDFIGGFGDYDGGNDITYEVKEGDNVIETFSMTGEGYGTIYRDDESEYVFFFDTDETTKVDIDAVSDLVFEDYIGDSLSIETTGSIEGGDITLNDENLEEDSGLTLRAGIDTENSVSNVFDGYTLEDFFDREMVDINHTGQVVGNDSSSGTETFFFYNGLGVGYLPGYESSRAFGINDYNQMIGEGVSLTSDDPHIPFLVFGDATVEEFTYGESSFGRPSPNSSGADVVYTYEPLAHPRDINNFVEIASYQLNTLPENAPPEFQPRSFEDAYFLAPNGNGSVNIGYSLLESDDSRAFGINDPGNVVGINRETDRAFVFNRANNSVTNLGTLPGGNYSAAYAINNVGQVVGVSTSAAGSRAFIYENGTMQDMGISYMGDPEKREGIDINNLGQVVVTSAAGEPLIYQDGVVTNVNDWLRPEVLSLGYTVTEAKGINDRGQIIAQGTFEGSPRGFLLNPTFQLVNRNINVGNISTFGETVLLEGAEVYLEGESITTQGGSIEFNGKTIVDNNLVIDSSITDDSVGNPDAESIDSLDSESEVTVAGGNITFTDTVNSNSAGDQSLTIKVGAGELQVAGEIGDESPLFDLMVEGAGLLSVNGDITVDNELHLEVINEITTANITTAGLANISLGTVGEDIFASNGDVTSGNIEALSLSVSNNGNFTAGDVTTSDGGINVISLKELAVGQLTATNGSINLISGNAGISVSGNVAGDLGFIATAPLDITTNEITSDQDAVILKSSQGAVSVNGSVSANGEVSLASANNVTVKAVTSKDGGVALLSATGIVNYSGVISSVEDITLASAKDLTVNQRITTELGTISVASTEGSVQVNTALNSGFNTYVAAKRNVTTLGIRSLGDVALESELGQVNANGNIRSGGGDIYISGLSRVNVGNVISLGGNVSVVSNASSIKTGYIRTDSEDRQGNVSLNALTNVKVAGVVNIDGVDYSIYAGDEGTVAITHQQLRRRSNDNDFVIGNIGRSGTLALASSSPIISYTFPIPLPVIIGTSIAGTLAIFAVIVNAGETAPAHQSEINPITSKPYFDEAEFELVKQLTPKQRDEIREWVNNPQRAVQLKPEEVFKNGKIDDDGCFTAEMPIHYGDWIDKRNFGLVNITHSKYATQITGAPGDYFVVEPESGLAALYDGLVNEGGQIVYELDAEPVGSVAEVKTGKQKFLRKFLPPTHPAYPNFDFNIEQQDINNKARFERQLDREMSVAILCGKKYFMSFSNKEAAEAAIFSYGSRFPAFALDIYNIPVAAST